VHGGGFVFSTTFFALQVRKVAAVAMVAIGWVGVLVIGRFGGGAAGVENSSHGAVSLLFCGNGIREYPIECRKRITGYKGGANNPD
jgi:hypothetical protein